MQKKSKILLSLSAAIASLTAAPVASEAKAPVISDDTSADQTSVKPAPTGYFQAGNDLLGFFTTQRADGTIVAGHSSHASHASHSSHSSHSSSRF